MMHEAQISQESCFVTLTYNDKNLPPYGALQLSDFQKFMKRLRKAYEPRKITFFHCGEYGENFSRPHYHAALFGVDFADKYYWAMRGQHRAYRSPTLESLWRLGNSEIGTLTFQSAQYIAGYVTKKITGKQAEEHYSYVVPETGEIKQLPPEYATMSRRPAIGKRWFEKYARDVFPSDEIIVDGRPVPPPRYYTETLAKEDPELYERIKRARKLERNTSDQSPDRLRAQEHVTKARQSLYAKRPLENHA